MNCSARSFQSAASLRVGHSLQAHRKPMGEDGKLVIHIESATTPRRILQRRVNQARYRAKKRKMAMELVQRVQQLRYEVAWLAEQRRSLATRIGNTGNAHARVVIDFFELFRYGLNSAGRRIPPRVAMVSPGWQTTTTPMPSQSEQLAFVRATTHPDLRLGDAIGPEGLITQNRLFCELHDDMHQYLEALEPLNVSEDGTTTFRTKVVLEVTFSPATIRGVFPHLERLESIKNKLIGRRISYHAQGVHVVDGDLMVTAVDWNLGMIEALMPFLTMEEAAIVLQGAHVSEDAFIAEIDPHSDAKSCDVNAADFDVQSRQSTDDNDAPHGRSFVMVHGVHGRLIHDGQGDDFVMV